MIAALTRKIFFGMGLMVSLLTLGSLLGGLSWVLDVLSHFHLHFALILLIIVPARLLLPKARWQGLVLLPALLVNLLVLAAFFMPTPTPLAAEVLEPLRVMSMNISTSTAGYPKVVELIRQREPDIVFLSEVRADLLALLASELAEDYPLQHGEPSSRTLGLALLARDPELRVETVTIAADVGRMSRRYLRADFSWQGRAVSLVGIHPLPPLKSSWAQSRNSELALMGKLAQESEQPFILIGDLNASPWSQAMRVLVRTSGLRYASRGYGIWPTWQLHRSGPGQLLSAPLDHIMLSSAWRVLDFTSSGDIGSDHLPLQADITLTPEP